MKTTWKATAEDVIDHLVYSGASQYDWYHQLHDEDGKIVVAIENGEFDDETGEPVVVTKTFTPTALIGVVHDIVANKKDGWRAVQEAISFDEDDADFDSDSADIVLQHAVLGGVVFG